MITSIDARLLKLGIELPIPPKPAANYVPFIKSGNLVFVSGQITFWDGKLQYVGRIGVDFSVDDGYQAARICGLNLLSHLRVACNKDLNRVRKVIKLGGFVNSISDFKKQPQIINGASDLMVEVFGPDIGTHSRFAVSVLTLPSGVATEVDGVFEIIN